jgi:hypothetical protein
MSAQILRIRDWSKHFENNRTRELNHIAWVPMPNKHDGDGYTELVDHPNGAAHFGAWCVIVQVASRCDPRGTLVRDRAVPHTAASLARITRFPEAVFDEVIPRLLDIGWLEWQPVVGQAVTEIPQEGAGESQEGAARVRASNGTESKGMEGKELNGRFDIESKADDSSDHSEILSTKAISVLAAIRKRVAVDGRDKFPVRVALAVGLGIVPEDFAIDAAQAVAAINPDKPGGYFYECVKQTCEKNGFDIGKIKAVKIPEGFPPTRVSTLTQEAAAKAAKSP